MPPHIPSLILTPGVEGELFTLALEGFAQHLTLAPPRFEVNKVERSDFQFVSQSPSPTELQHGTETLFLYRDETESPALTLTVAVRTHEGSPFLRFRYTLHADTEAQLTKGAGQDKLFYFGARFSPDDLALTEIQLSHFDPVAHSYLPYRKDFPPDLLSDPLSFVGPIAILHHEAAAFLLAYEHGADHPDSFFDFTLTHPEAPQISLAARKGNYWHGLAISPEQGFTSVWFRGGRPFHNRGKCGNAVARVSPFLSRRGRGQQRVAQTLSLLQYLELPGAAQILRGQTLSRGDELRANDV